MRREALDARRVAGGQTLAAMRWLGAALLLSLYRWLGGAWDDEAILAPRHPTTRFLSHRSHLTAEHHAMAWKEEDLIDTTVTTYSVIVVEHKVS